MKTFDHINTLLGGNEIASNWSQHPNGGGWVRNDAEVHPEAYIGEEAIVLSSYRKAQVMRGGVMRGGVMRGGVMRGGDMCGGEMWGGVMRGGVMRGGVMCGGVMRGGVMRGGVMRGGEMRDGVMRGGEMRGGVMRGGEMRGGVMRGGVMRGGEMWGGEMWGGEWETSPLFVQGSKHCLANAKPGYLQIGCRCESYLWWASKEALQFARDNGYTAAEIKEYKAYIALFKKIGRPAED